MTILEDALRKVPPQSLDAEESVLGSILLDPNALDRVIEAMTDADFYRESHRKIFRAMISLSEKNEPIDLVTLTDTLKGRGELQDVGGAIYLAELSDKVPSAANVAHYARIIREKAVLRSLINVSNEIASRCYSGEEDLEQFLDEAERLIFDVSEKRIRPAFFKLGDMIMDTIKIVEKLYERKEMVTGVPTGFLDLDRMTAGLQPADLVIVAARPSMGKCLKADAEIVDAQTGEVKTIEQLCRSRQATLLTLDSRLKLHAITPSHYVDDGIKPVYRVTTALGRVVETTFTHPFLTVGGWRPLSELPVGTRIAVPRTLPVFGTGDLPDHTITILAYLLGDGDLTQACPRFTNGNPRIMADFQASLVRFGELRGTVNDSQGTRTPTCRVAAQRDDETQVRKVVGQRLRLARDAVGLSQRGVAIRAGVSPALLCAIEQGKQSPVPTLLECLAGIVQKPVAWLTQGTTGLARGNRLTQWLAEQGLMGKGAAGKFIPGVVFTLPKDKLALFLNRLFSCDGSACLYRTGQAAISYSSVSRKLAQQVQHLLLRFGIVSKLREKHVRYDNTFRIAYEVEMLAAQDILTFAHDIGIFGKEEKLREVVAIVEQRRQGWTKDTLPLEVWTLVNAARAGQTWRSIYAQAGLPVTHNIHNGRHQPRRETVQLLGQVLKSQLLMSLATSDVYWDTITTIESIGDHQVYDLTIPETHNFIANDVLVHNTAFVMNIAQYVALHANTAVGVFSLEMSKEQLVMRMLCSEARVDNAKVRAGYLGERDFPRLAMAAGRLGDAPIFIDDTPAQNVLELRAKARRLKREANLGLVIVDYLQLMRGLTSQENRTQELSEISRGLKSLAKELNIPVVALSQLNRQVEQRADRRPMMSDIRECVPGDTLVTMADGQRVPIRDLVGATPEVLAVSSGGRIVKALSDQVWRVGERPIFTVHLASGRRIQATARHRVLGGEGWKRVAELAVGDRLAIARTLSEPVNPQVWAELLDDEELRRRATNDLFWDRVVAIEPAGEAEVFDLTVPGPASWLADGIVSHNSGAIEQDADVIAFIYRDEVYKQDSQDEGIAEIIIGKQRNGPTGTVRLAFRKEYTRFDNLVEKTDVPSPGPIPTDEED